MELKITISRSYSRKQNLGNYESQDFFANYSEEIDATSTPEKIAETSALLYDMARGDVEKAMNKDSKNYGDVDPETRKQMEQTDWKLTELAGKVRKNIPILISEWESLTRSQQDFLHKQQLLRNQEERFKQKDVENNIKGK